MFCKKAAKSLLAAAIVVVGITVSAPTVSAARHHKSDYPVCTVEDCSKTGNHKHKGVTYCAHSTSTGKGHCSQSKSSHHGRHH